jgi:hypothetical protein
MVSATPEMTTSDWINNRDWYDRFIPDFVLCSTASNTVIDMICEGDVVARFGPPSDRFAFGDMAALVYAPENLRFRFWLRDHPFRVRFLRPDDKAVFSSADLSLKGVTYVSEKTWPEGAIAFGISRCMPAGTYSLTVNYDVFPRLSKTVPDIWEVRSVLRDQSELVASGVLDGMTNCATGTFSLRKMLMVNFRILFAGKNALAVDGMSLERVE